MTYSARKQSSHLWNEYERPIKYSRTCMKNLKHFQANIGTCMKNMETNQVNLGASLKNVETQMEKLSQSLKENPLKSFSSDIEKNLKQCMAVTLRSGKKLDEPRRSKMMKSKWIIKIWNLKRRWKLRLIKRELSLTTKERNKNMMKLSEEE